MTCKLPIFLSIRDLGFEDNIDTYGIVSGLYNSIYCFGAFLGPTVGGWMMEEWGFGWAATVIAGIYVLAVSVLTMTINDFYEIDYLLRMTQWP